VSQSALKKRKSVATPTHLTSESRVTTIFPPDATLLALRASSTSLDWFPLSFVRSLEEAARVGATEVEGSPS